MPKSRKVGSLAAAVALSALATAAIVLPIHAVAAVDRGADIAEAVVFGVSAPRDATAVGPQAAELAPKGDFAERPGCFGQVWPDITAECLTKATGAAAAPVRTVTMGYQVGDATTVLVRMPALQTASR